MEINPLLVLCVAWVLGILVGGQAFAQNGELPTLFTVLGFVTLAGLTATFYFGKTAPLLMIVVGILESGIVKAYPVAGILLGMVSIGSALYGRTLGLLALDDFYESGQTRLPGLTLAAFLNFLLLLAFGLLVWFLFPILPSAAQLGKWFPLPGLGV